MNTGIIYALLKLNALTANSEIIGAITTILENNADNGSHNKYLVVLRTLIAVVSSATHHCCRLRHIANLF